MLEMINHTLYLQYIYIIKAYESKFLRTIN